ncbi:MAG TPA: polynucleotide kinase-phosphatase [Candidatus Angelobacter sp.]
MKITIPELSLVVLIGPSGCGKSTFARKHFKPSEILSSDFCRGLVSDDENDQSATGDAFETLHFIARKRLARARLTVVDATNVQPEARKPLVDLAREYHALPVAIVLNLPERLCHERNQGRPDRAFGPHVVRNQLRDLRQALRGLEREGFRHLFVLSSVEEIDSAVIERQPLWNNLKHEHGPFDIIGDIHGCCDELIELLIKLGYARNSGGVYQPPVGRKAVFLGDLVDRGPKIPETVRLVVEMVKAGHSLCVPGNHDVKFMRAIWGKKVQITHGLGDSLEQFKAYDQSYHGFSRIAAEFMDSLVSHYVLDDGNLVVAHAGMKEEMQGRGSGKVREFALYGETTGETDEFGLPVRYNWAADYRGRAMVVYGHTPVAEAEWLNRTINIDTGCVFGGRLTALRYPERELVSVPAHRTYYDSAKPFFPAAELAPALTAQQQQDDLLEIDDVLGKRIISTRLHRNITIREENSTAALETMSRFAANPKWLIYLPPTMSPCETSRREGLLEHPDEAFSYYRHEGVGRVICEQKHMGSRALVIVCRDHDQARKRFGVVEEGIGICYTRTGRRFFNDLKLEAEFLSRIQAALTRAGFWEEFSTGWVCLDCELMPWSAKAQELLRRQYATTGAAARAALPEAIAALETAAVLNPGISPLLARYRERFDMAEKYVAAYRNYCWPVSSVDDLRLAPFHLLATEGAIHTAKDHAWHMETLARICGHEDPLLLATPHMLVDLADSESQATAVAWWEELTAKGGEGMVVKPLDFIATGPRGLVQPAVKCRGREYLRIIYGPEYTAPQNLERLRARGLGRKRSLALREFALGVEALERFVRLEPLRRVHECVFGVLALESEPVDPRL